MVRPLIPERSLIQFRQIVARTYRSTCRIGRVPMIESPRGGSYPGDPVYDDPIPCRLDPPGVSREVVRGERIISITGASVSFSLDVIPPDNADVIEVTTPDIGLGSPRVELYNVVGIAVRGASYALETTIAVERLGD